MAIIENIKQIYVTDHKAISITLLILALIIAVSAIKELLIKRKTAKEKEKQNEEIKRHRERRIKVKATLANSVEIIMNRYAKQNFFLNIELVPQTAWYINLRNRNKEEWDILRKMVYSLYGGNKCGVCKVSGKVNCHEIWDYDDNSHIQKLIGFIALCDLCHHVKHIGLADILSSKGELDFDKVVNHFIRINNCTKNIFEKYREEAFKKWRERNQYKWELNLGGYDSLIEKKYFKLRKEHVYG